MNNSCLPLVFFMSTAMPDLKYAGVYACCKGVIAKK